MQRTGLARQYDQLTAKERLQLVLEAQSRDDMAEVRKLVGSCPRKAYRQLDDAFDGPYEAVKKIVLALGIDLAYQLGHLRMLAVFQEALPCMLLAAGCEAVDRDRGEPSDTGPDAVPQQTPSGSGDQNADDPNCAEDRSLEIERTYADNLPETKAQFDSIVGRLRERYRARAHGIVVALDRFGRRVLEMDGKTLLRAWQPTALQSCEQLEVESVEPDEKWADDFEESTRRAWATLLGSGTTKQSHGSDR